MELLTTILRTVILYIVLISGIRLMGKRQIGQLEPSELVVTMLVADLAAGPIQEGGFNVLAALIAIGTILLMEILLSTLSLHSSMDKLSTKALWLFPDPKPITKGSI